MLRLLPGISSLLISISVVRAPSFFPKPLSSLPPPLSVLVVHVANAGACVGLQNKSGRHAHRHRRLVLLLRVSVEHKVQLVCFAGIRNATIGFACSQDAYGGKGTLNTSLAPF